MTDYVMPPHLREWMDRIIRDAERFAEEQKRRIDSIEDPEKREFVKRQLRDG